MSKRILYNFPSRERPEKVIRCIENIISLAKHDNYIIGLTLDVDDTTTANKEFNEKLKKYGGKVSAVYGFSKNKIDAINKNVWMYNDWDIVCNHSDDFVFTKEGFDLDILDGYADGFSGLLHFPDQHANQTLCTYAIKDKNYYNLFGYIYHPSFQSVYCDNLQMDVAKYLGKYKFISKNIFEHQHPIWGFGKADALLNRTEDKTIYQQDRETYMKLKNNNFGL